MKKDPSEKKAVALKYEHLVDKAPKIIATGHGKIAETIIEIAKANKIEIKKDKELAEILSVMDVDTYIPIEAYVAVAEILSYLYKNKGKNLKSPK